MLDLVLLTLATFWVWETAKYAAERYVGGLFAATRPVHPLLVAALPLYVLWPDWVSALAVAGAVGILHLAVERLVPPAVVPYRPRARTGQGLPPLP